MAASDDLEDQDTHTHTPSTPTHCSSPSRPAVAMRVQARDLAHRPVFDHSFCAPPFQVLQILEVKQPFQQLCNDSNCSSSNNMSAAEAKEAIH